MKQNTDPFVRCQLNAPVGQAAVAQLEQHLGMQLPEEYLRILTYSNGLEGWISDKTYLVLWRVEELLRNNESVEAPRLIPGILLIGTAGDGEVIALDMRDGRDTYGCFFLLATSPLDWEDAEPLGCTVEEAFEKLKNPFNLRDEDAETLREK